MTTQTPRVFNDRYELTRHIARGGMAEVWLAQDQLLDRPVAVKVLFPELSIDQSFVERFRREAQAAANLSHPNIVSIYDWGEADGTYFIVMEYIDGRSLATIIRNESPLVPERAAGIAGEVAAALGFAHQNNVVHRDVKPANVLIDGNGLVKVADFGIARAADSSSENLTQTGAVMGTATYFSPEQAQGNAVDRRTDVYALGCVLYEMVTGRAPFTGDNPVAIAYKHVSEEPVAPSRRNANVPAALDAVILKALAKDPAKRYATAEEFRADLIRFRQGKPVMALGAAATAQANAATQAANYLRDGSEPTVMAAPVTTVNRAIAMDVDDDYEYSDKEPFFRRTGTYVAILLVMLAILGILLFALANSFSGGNGSTSAKDQVAIPTDLVGRQESDARSALERLGFTVVTTNDPNVDAPDGAVTGVDPAGGTFQNKGSSVRLTVKGGVVQIDVPNVEGKTYADAETALKKLGFDVGRIDQDSETIAADIVLTQSVPYPSKAAKGTKIDLTVSKGAPVVVVPDLGSKDSAEAANQLGQLGLKSTTKQEASDSVAAGQVIRTEPAKDAQVAKGTTVVIIVSSGQSLVTVPNLVGKSEDAAVAVLDTLSLGNEVQESLTTDASKVGKVISQSPVATTAVAKNSKVTIQIGKLVPVSTTTTSSTTTTTTSP